MTTKRTERRPTAPARPVLEAERRAADAKTRADEAREAARKATANLAEMREDRDRWRTQAERLSAALERLRAPVPIPVTLPLEQAATRAEGDDSDLLYGVRAIAGFLKIKEHQARHRIEAGQIPTFKIGGTICAARSGLNRWFAAQGASNGSGEVH